MGDTDDDLLQFINSSFQSVWALETLLVLKRELRPWNGSELVAMLRASQLVVDNALQSLVVAGLVSINGEGASFRPANDYIAASVERVEQLYRSRPNTVRRAIVAAATGSSAAAFADAFKLRKD